MFNMTKRIPALALFVSSLGTQAQILGLKEQTNADKKSDSTKVVAQPSSEGKMHIHGFKVTGGGVAQAFVLNDAGYLQSCGSLSSRNQDIKIKPNSHRCVDKLRAENSRMIEDCKKFEYKFPE